MDKRVNLISKEGDGGISSLYSGERISKSSARLEALGDLDELVGVLGVARAHAQKKRVKEELLDVQRKLFILGSELATTDDKLEILPSRVDDFFIANFEKQVQALQDDTDVKAGFIIPGNSIPAAYINHARTIARRCERRVVSLFENKETVNGNLLIFLNRLSVYLYLMVRFEDPEPTMAKE